MASAPFLGNYLKVAKNKWILGRLVLQGCSELIYTESQSGGVRRQQMKCFDWPSLFLIHSSSSFPRQCCISLSFVAAVLHFLLFFRPLSTFSLLPLFSFHHLKTCSTLFYPWLSPSCVLFSQILTSSSFIRSFLPYTLSIFSHNKWMIRRMAPASEQFLRSKQSSIENAHRAPSPQKQSSPSADF